MQDDINCICAREAVVIVTHLVAAALQLHLTLHVTNQFIPYLCGSERACPKNIFNPFICDNHELWLNPSHLKLCGSECLFQFHIISIHSQQSILVIHSGDILCCSGWACPVGTRMGLLKSQTHNFQSFQIPNPQRLQDNKYSDRPHKKQLALHCYR